MPRSYYDVLAGARLLLALSLPLVPQDAHGDEIDIFPVAPHVLAQTALFLKAAGAVGADGAFVVAVDSQPDLALVAQAKGVIQQDAHSVAPVALALVFSIDNADSQTASLRYCIEVEEAAVADIFAIGLNSKIGAVAPALLRLLIEFGFQPGQRLWLPGVASAKYLELHIVIESPLSLYIFALHSA